jgi:hypothetical protein
MEAVVAYNLFSKLMSELASGSRSSCRLALHTIRQSNAIWRTPPDVREHLRTSWMNPLISTMWLRELGVTAAYWGNIWMVAAGDKIDDEGEQGEGCVEGETGDGS